MFVYGFTVDHNIVWFAFSWLGQIEIRNIWR